jgi:cytochrome c biogenesis protein ResB
MKKAPEYVEKFEFTPPVVRNPVVKLLGGLTFGLLVLTAVLIASTIGEFLPQDENSTMALDLVFKTWWYRGLLFLLGINLILNTYITYVEETYPQFLPVFRKNPDSFKPLKIKHKATFNETAAADSKTLMQSLANALHAKGYRAFFDGTSLYAHRGLIARFGSTVTHLGLITIIVGALAESLLKEEGIVRLAEGESTSGYYYEDELVITDPKTGQKMETQEPPKNPLGLTATLHDFDFTQYPGTGIASKFKSTMTWEGKSKEPLQDYVRVNHDIKYGGWVFHQQSFTELKPPEITRYYVALKEDASYGREIMHRLEMYAYPSGREIKPLPGHDDRFICLETDPASRSVIWTVTSKDAILARGTKSSFGDLRIEMLRFYPDFAVSEEGWVVNKSDQPNNPAAQVEISSNNTVIYRDWVHMKDSQYAQKVNGESMIDLVMLDYDLGTEPAAPPAPVGKIDVASGSPVADASSASIEKRAVVTVSLRSAQTGEPMGVPYKLRLGEGVPLSESADPRFDIPGKFDLVTLKSIPIYASYLSVSKNPGIPIVWLGSIFATFGPVLAFFVSRRRVWAHVDMAKRQIWFGGESRYSRDALMDEISDLAREWSQSEAVAMKPALQFSGSGSTEKLETI